MRKSLITAAILALSVTAAHAQPGGGNPGKGADKGGGAAQGPMKGKERGGGPGKDHARNDNRGGPAMNRAENDRRAGPPAAREGSERRSPGKADKGPNVNRRDGDVVRIDRVRDDGRDGSRRLGDRDARYIDRVVERRTIRRNFVDGCPPGLAKKFNGCMPPGLAKQRAERRYYRPDFWGYSFGDNRRYLYRDGYLLRLGANDRISAFVPLLGGALSLGSQWPSFYEPRASLDPYYVDYFDLGPPRSYRYADNVIYRVNPETTAIMSVAALLTGDQFTVGQPMPAGYGVYNVPFAYRDRYYDRPDALYRYSDGHVYEIDPKTMLVASAISLAV